MKDAQAAEGRGDLRNAAAAWIQAGRHGDAVRVILIMAQGELDAHRRAQILAQATAVAPPGHPARLVAWRARANFVIDRVRTGGLDPAIRRRDLLDAGHALKELGDPELAAEVLRLAGDLEGEIGALVEAGNVPALEDAFARQRHADQARSQLVRWDEEARDLVALGRRREAVDRLTSALAQREAESLRTLLESLWTRRAMVPVVVRVDGIEVELVAGDTVVLGRSEGDLRIPSPLLSRRHLSISRGDDGTPWVRDLGARNGTTLCSARIEALPVGTGLNLQLGGALPCSVWPHTRGGVWVELPRRLCWLPLGPMDFGTTKLRPESNDGWLEVHVEAAHPILLGELEVSGSIQLLVGDELFERRSGPSLLRVIRRAEVG